MFDRFLRFIAIRRAIEREHFEHAFELLEDRWIREHRKSEELRQLGTERLLARVDRRLALGELGLASADLEILKRRATGHPDVGKRDAQLEEAKRAGRDLASTRERARERIRMAMQTGELEAAELALAEARATEPLATDLVDLSRQLALRREEAAAMVAAAEDFLAAGDGKAALERCAAARSRNPHAGSVVALARRLAAERVRAWQRGEVLDLETTDPERLLRAWVAEVTHLPEIASAPGVAKVVTGIEVRVRERLVELARRGALEELALSARAFAAGVAQLGDDGELAAALESLEAGLTARAAGEFAVAAETLAASAKVLGSSHLLELARGFEHAEAECAQALAQARTKLTQGDPLAAKEAILAALARHANHAGLRRESDALERSSQERAERLAKARAAASDGRLEGARQFLIGLASAGRECEEARLLLQEVQGRMDQVQRGLGQILRAVHGRDTASREGLRHCLARAEQLSLVQKDSAEVERVAAALRAELAGLEDLDSAEAARASGRVEEVLAALRTFAGRRGTFLDPNRLRARLLEFEDRVRSEAEAHLAAGRPHASARAAAVLAELETLDASDPVARHDLLRRADLRIAEAQVCVNEASALLARNDVDAAEARLDRARELAADGADVRRLDDRLRTLRVQEARVREVEALAKADDVVGANRRLAEMPPTSPLMRTRVFDLKQSLARAQGLDHGFLLRVDEGGEWVTLRADSITIGNLRDGTSDLRLLANLAGRHARFQRSMSFHGGMQDKIVAERGEVHVNGARVDSRALRHGDRIRLGALVELLYEMPVGRSLSARLKLLGGFQVAGATRILMMKDKGRDGRILIGAGVDCHVQVPGATGEVELFADRDGQVKVRVQGQGEMAGAPFRDEHPVVPGGLIRASGITMTLLPWPLG